MAANFLAESAISMAIIRVPTDFPSIQAALDAAANGDTVEIEASFASASSATITQDNLTIVGLTATSGIVLTLDAGVSDVTISGTTDFVLVDNAQGNSIATGAANDVVQVAGGNDTVGMELGAADDDHLIVDWAATTGDVTGGYLTYQTTIPEGDILGAFYNTQAGYRVDFEGVERFTIFSGSGNDSFALGFFDDMVSLGAGDDSVNTFGGNVTIDGGAGIDHWQGDLSLEAGDIVLDLETALLNEDIGGGNFVEGIERLTLVTGSGHDWIVTLDGLLTDTLVTGAGNDTVIFRGGVDYTLMGLGAADDDHLIIDWSATSGDVTGGYTLYHTTIADGDIYGTFYNNEIFGTAYYVNFEGVDRFTISTGSGNDNFITGFFGDAVSLGAGNDTVNTQDGDDSISLIGDGTDNIFAGPGDNSLSIDFSGSTASVANGTDSFVSAGYGTVTYSAIARFTLDLSQFDDIVQTFDGDDVLFGNEGNDELYGNSGADRLEGGLGNDLLDGGADIDTASYAGASAAVDIDMRVAGAQNTGSAGTDTLVSIEILIGSNFNDMLISDLIAANELRGGLGNDRYYLYQSTDLAIELAGQGTADRVEAFANVTLGATSEIETMIARLTTGMSLGGSDTANRIDGNTGADTLNGNGGNDTLNGLDGNDTLNGGNGNDALDGGAGNDVLNGGADTDTATYATATSAVTVSLLLATAQNTLGAGTDTLTGIENLIGSAFNDTLTGSTGDNTINGGGGADTINGREGVDTMAGGAGDDRYFVDNAGDIVVETGNAGSDRVFTTVNYTLGAGQTIEFLFANAGATALTLHGNELANNIQGNTGNDTLFGHDGNDILEGRGGIDDMTGGNGNDKYYVDDASDVLHEGASEGTLDIAYASVSYTLGAGVYVERLYANGGSTGLTLQGNEFNNLVFGASGNDTLMGHDGADTLTGNAGNDRLIGGTGIDTLFGNAGADTFVLQNLAADRDGIRDFAAGDRIEVSASLFGGGLAAGALAANRFVSNGTGFAGDGDDRFIYNTSNGALYFDIDGNGATARVHIATLTGMPTLTAGDFTVAA